MGAGEDDGPYPAAEKRQTLLQKYEIPIEHLSYEYIETCSNAKEMERIVRILRSGEEGSYPHLTSTAEARLSTLRPDSALLREPCPVTSRASLSASERQALDSELDGCLAELKLLERDLEEERTSDQPVATATPAVRASNVPVQSAAGQSQGSKVERFKSTDYAAWDGYDADAEINRIELEEEKRRIEARRLQDRRDASSSVEAVVEKAGLTGTEQHVLAAREREKGNEAYRAADYAEALRLYSASIVLNGDADAYNNRAMTHIKLKNYKEALKDCNEVLNIDCSNVKALLRRGFTLERLNKSEEALKDYEHVLTINPTDATAISSVKRLRSDNDIKKVRLTIEEIHDEG